MSSHLEILLKANQKDFYPVVPFNPAEDTLVPFDFTDQNTTLTAPILNYTAAFTAYIENILKQNKARYGFGGYAEHRTVYSRSEVFNAPEPGGEPRRLHLGIDIWGKAGTRVFAPLGGRVHGLGFHEQFGDYGAVIILSHQLEGFSFYTLYGHLSLKDIGAVSEGHFLNRGTAFAHFGEPHENGHWPPHLHFQLIIDMGMNREDYPGVCRLSEKEKWLENSPDPDLILNMRRWLNKTG